MSAAADEPTTGEPTIGQRVSERPSFDPGKLRELKPRELAIRFSAGALTSIVAGAATLAFGARAAGILLAFPAILAASLTLIEEQEDSEDAREDARGAVIGGLALALFAAVGTLGFTHLAAPIVLALAAAAWLAAAVIGYAVAWFR
jgi:hypothetical protein